MMKRNRSYDRNDNFEWLMSQNLSEYEGYWISVIDTEIVAKSKSLREVVAKSRKKYPDKRPFVVKITSPSILAV